MTVVKPRTRLDRLLDGNPSLRPRLAEIVAAEFPRATRQAVKELGLCDDRAGVAAVRAAARRSAEQVAGDWWPEGGCPTDRAPMFAERLA